MNFANYRDGPDPDGVDDKDAGLFPVAIPDPSGRPELAILHRPLFSGTRPEETALHPAVRAVDLNQESIWSSYCERAPEGDPPSRFGRFVSHRPGRRSRHACRFDVYHGMADDRIGVARLDLPDALPLGGVAHSPDAKV